ncbi:hypothetical protein P691DRAFT_800326 [Macrolepiota fuliginosa MF-IS2]|uniref:Uncharacterized protein n=1 Tax=Macrolepiota fuliginosa MF-IS2 TaxID=1400762 RepID=A0A9P5XEC0_9AGAR|nr:hypothetical protein P691DRAFT_800326 [Macrolepiota fuliginosa MF-IS2]
MGSVFKHTIFSDLVTCRLPYVEVVSDEEYSCYGVAITDDVIVGRDYNDPGPPAVDVLRFE